MAMQTIRLNSPTGDSQDTTVTLEDGTLIPGVSRISFDLCAGEMAKAKLEFIGTPFDVKAHADLVPLMLKIWRQLSPIDQAHFINEIKHGGGKPE